MAMMHTPAFSRLIYDFGFIINGVLVRLSDQEGQLIKLFHVCPVSTFTCSRLISFSVVGSSERVCISSPCS